MLDMKEGSQRVSLLSVSVRGYGQNTTIYILNVSLWNFIKAHVQNGVSVFELEAHEDSEVYHTVLSRKIYLRF